MATFKTRISQISKSNGKVILANDYDASIKNLDPKYVFTTPEGELAYIPEIGGVPQDLSDPSKIQAYQAVPDLSDIGQGDFGALAYYAPDVAEIGLDMFGAKKLSQGILKPRTGRGGSFDTGGLLRSQLLRDFAGYGTASGLLNVGRQGVASLAADQDVADFDFNVAQPITNLVFSGGFGSIPNYLLSKKASNLENFAESSLLIFVGSFGSNVIALIVVMYSFGLPTLNVSLIFLVEPFTTSFANTGGKVA